MGRSFLSTYFISNTKDRFSGTLDIWDLRCRHGVVLSYAHGQLNLTIWDLHQKLSSRLSFCSYSSNINSTIHEAEVEVNRFSQKRLIAQNI